MSVPGSLEALVEQLLAHPEVAQWCEPSRLDTNRSRVTARQSAGAEVNPAPPPPL
ncbi:MAG: hypothetical protein ACRDSP_22730 [Pseudonocardiaceae bacterium]